jgi:hypothetical protein
MARWPLCQQVMDDRTKRRCGKAGKLRMGLCAILCDDCNTRAERIVRAAWGIE